MLANFFVFCFYAGKNTILGKQRGNIKMQYTVINVFWKTNNFVTEIQGINRLIYINDKFNI